MAIIINMAESNVSVDAQSITSDSLDVHTPGGPLTFLPTVTTGSQIISHSGRVLELTGTLVTTDASIQPIIIFSTASNKNYVVEFWSNGYCTAGTDANLTVGYRFSARIKNVAGTVTSTTFESAISRDAGMSGTPSFVVSGTNVQLSVQGVVSQTMSWQALATITICN